MSDTDGVEKKLTEIIKMTYPDLLEPSFKEIGEGLKTIIEFLSIPLLRLKYQSKKAQLRFEKRVKKLIIELDNVPEEDRKEIPSSIANPTIDQLSIESDEDIGDIYINLLTKASSRSQGKFAHPSFFNALKNLSNDEAKIMEYLRDKWEIPYIIIRLQFDETNGIDKTTILTAIESKIELNYPDNIPLYFENLCGLGILSKEVGSLSDKDRWYKPLFNFYEPLRKKI